MRNARGKPGMCEAGTLGIITHSIRISSFLRGGGDYYISSWPYHQSRRHKCVIIVVAHIKRRENNTRPRRRLSKRINYRRIYVRLGQIRLGGRFLVGMSDKSRIHRDRFQPRTRVHDLLQTWVYNLFLGAPDLRYVSTLRVKMV